MWCFFRVIVSKPLKLFTVFKHPLGSVAKNHYFSVNFALCSSDCFECVACSSFLLNVTNIENCCTFVFKSLQRCFLPVSQILYLRLAMSKFTNRFLSPSFLILNLEKKASPHHMGFGFSLRMAKWLYCFPGETSAPLCVLLSRKKTPEYFLGVEKRANPPSFLGVVFRPHINNVFRNLVFSSCELWD